MAGEASQPIDPLVVGRYAVFDPIAAGGMASVHLGRLLGAEGFGRTVAIKRLHPHYLKDREFIAMFMDEARIVARIRHPNVVAMSDVVHSSEGLFLVMEYVHGETLSRLLRAARAAGEVVPREIVAAVLHDALLGLHSAHQTKGPSGEPLEVVHRDVSPQNIIVGSDGIARVLDFGVAKAVGRAQVTREGQIKGKLAYMAPEQIRGQVDRRTDVFASAVVLWEALAGRRLHEGLKEVEIITRIVRGALRPPSEVAEGISPELDAVVMRGLAANPDERFESARALANELTRCVELAPPADVSAWVERLARDALDERATRVAAMERASASLTPSESPQPPAFELLSADLAPPDAPAEEISLDLDEPFTTTEPLPAPFPPPPDPRPLVSPAPAAPPLSRQLRVATFVVLGVSLLLAVTGLALGAYALLRSGWH